MSGQRPGGTDNREIIELVKDNTTKQCLKKVNGDFI